jgi:putative membrane protein
MKIAVAAASLLTLVAVARPAWAQATTTAPTPAPRLVPGQQDLAFIQQAAIGSAAEVEMGKLAMQQSADPAIRVFGRWMTTDHQFANELLANLAQVAGVSLPAAYDQEHQAAYDRLRALSGAAFDREYIPDQVRMHQQTIALFQQEAASGANPQLILFAERMLPTLQQHLAQAQEFEQRLAVASAANSRAAGQRRAKATGSGSSASPGRQPAPPSAGSSGPMEPNR